MWFRNQLNSTGINGTGITLVNVTSYKCDMPQQFSGRSLLDFDTSHIESDCNPRVLMWVLIAAGISSAVVVVVAVILYTCRWRIALRWYYLKKYGCCGRRPAERQHLLADDSAIGPFDVAIAHYDADEAWVAGGIVDKLQDRNQSLRLFYDNSPPGASWPDIIGKFKLFIMNQSISLSNHDLLYYHFREDY